MAKSLRSNPVVIHSGATIGHISAEADDEFLFECFVDHPALDILRDTKSSKMFLSARTGAGKTAIVRMVQRQYPIQSSLIDLPGLSMDYVANSDIIRFLKSIDVDLDLFFQALWKHVLCIEYIRMRYKINDEGQSRDIFRLFTDIFRTDGRKQSAIRYLSEWEGKFFITMDENIKEVTSKLETKINGDLGAEVHKFSARAGYSRTLSAEKRAEIVARAKKIVNANQLADLNRVLDLLSDVDGDKKYGGGPYYILIDRLDEKWVDEGIRFDLIRALIECLKSFNKLGSLKIIVAIREDVLEKVIQETKDVGFQREKYDDYFLRMQWNADQLKELVRKRINSLYRRKYTTENVTFHDIFRSKISGKDPLEYILERTLYRPRDVISFINECLRKAQGSTEVNSNTIKEAEAEYSRIRMQALIQEWQGAFPSLVVALKLLANKKGRFKSEEIATKEFLDDFVLEVDHNDISFNDPIKKVVNQYMKDGTEHSIISTARILISQLYRIGAIGLKMSSGERYIYSYQDVPLISPENIDTETKIHVHPMLHRALNVSPEFSMRNLAGHSD